MQYIEEDLPKHDVKETMRSLGIEGAATRRVSCCSTDR
jgi:hypothetical protein